MALLRSGTRIYGNATIDTVLKVDGTDSSSSNSTGALQVAGGVGVVGNVYSSGNVTGNYLFGNGYYLTGIDRYGNGNVANYLPTYTGDLSANNAVFTGNLTVGGALEYTNVTNLYVKDPIIDQGGGANGAELTSNDSMDRGSLLHYYDTTPVNAFIGWKTANSEFVVSSNVSVSNNQVTINQLGNLRANVFLGNLSGSATTVTASSQPNITSVGTLGNLTVTNNVNANTLTGTLTTNAQPNITSVGSLSSLTVTGALNLNGPGYVKITGGNAGEVLSTDGTSNLSWTSNIANANYAAFAGNVTSNSQPNITSVGNLASLNVTGNIRLDAGISLAGNFGQLGQMLTAKGNNTVSWTSKFYYGNLPPQAYTTPVTPNYGDVWYYVDNDLDPPVAKLYMWVNDGTSEYFYDFLPPTN